MVWAAFDWSSQYALVDADGNPDSPDALTYAKRAQVGGYAFLDLKTLSRHLLISPR